MENNLPNKDSNNVTPVTSSTGGYGQKGGWKKWLLIYLVVGAIVYAAIYYFWLRDSGSGTGTFSY